MIPQIIDWLTNANGYKDSFVYQTMMSKVKGGEENARSYALRLLIHYIGDIHQPLHACARVDTKYPKGDAGGNLFHVPSKENAKNLHAVWDSGVYAYAGNPKLVRLSLII